MVSSTEHRLILLPWFALWIFVGPSHVVYTNCVHGTSISSSRGSYAASMPCVKKLLPCQEYLKLTATTPPPSCCVPLKEMISDDPKCLCDIFNNVDILKKLNITQDGALRLPKACGANANISACSEDGPPPTDSPATPGNSSAASKNSNSSATSENSSFSDNSSPTKSAANVMSYLAGSGFIAGFLGLVISSS